MDAFLLVLGICLSAFFLLALGEVGEGWRQGRKEARRQARRPAAERIEEVREWAANSVSTIESMRDRDPDAGPEFLASMSRVCDCLRRIESLASTPRPSAQGARLLADEARVLRDDLARSVLPSHKPDMGGTAVALADRLAELAELAEKD